MNFLIIAVGVVAAALLGLSTVFCVALAWIHYPQGIIKAARQKKKEHKAMNKKRELCVPCAVKLAETNDVKKTGHRRDKITCSECQRRRYGGEYEVSPKAEKGANHDTLPE